MLNCIEMPILNSSYASIVVASDEHEATHLINDFWVRRRQDGGADRLESRNCGRDAGHVAAEAARYRDVHALDDLIQLFSSTLACFLGQMVSLRQKRVLRKYFIRAVSQIGSYIVGDFGNQRSADH